MDLIDLNGYAPKSKIKLQIYLASNRHILKIRADFSIGKNNAPTVKDSVGKIPKTSKARQIKMRQITETELSMKPSLTSLKKKPLKKIAIHKKGQFLLEELQELSDIFSKLRSLRNEMLIGQKNKTNNKTLN